MLLDLLLLIVIGLLIIIGVTYVALPAAHQLRVRTVARTTLRGAQWAAGAATVLYGSLRELQWIVDNQQHTLCLELVERITAHQNLACVVFAAVVAGRAAFWVRGWRADGPAWAQRALGRGPELRRRRKDSQLAKVV